MSFTEVRGLSTCWPLGNGREDNGHGGPGRKTKAKQKLRKEFFFLKTPLFLKKIYIAFAFLMCF